MTYTEILEKLKEFYPDGVEEFAYDDGPTEIEGVGKMEEIHQQGGEGEGDHWESVKFFPEHNVYIKVVGFYSTYNGTDFDGGWSDCHQVSPKEKVITVFE